MAIVRSVMVAPGAMALIVILKGDNSMTRFLQAFVSPTLSCCKQRDICRACIPVTDDIRRIFPLFAFLISSARQPVPGKMYLQNLIAEVFALIQGIGKKSPKVVMPAFATTASIPPYRFTVSATISRIKETSETSPGI